MLCAPTPTDAIGLSARSLLRAIVVLMIVCLIQIAWTISQIIRLGFIQHSPEANNLIYHLISPSLYSVLLLLGFLGVRRRSVCLLKTFYVLQAITVVLSVALVTGVSTYLAVSQPDLVQTACDFARKYPVQVAIGSVVALLLLVVKLRSIFYARVLALQLTLKSDALVEMKNVESDSEEPLQPAQPMFVVQQPAFAAPANGQEALYMQIPATAHLIPVYVDRAGNPVH